eukprot:s6628_g6.t1
MQITATGPAAEAGFYRSGTPFLLGTPRAASKSRWEGRHFAAATGVSAGLAATWRVARRVRLCASPTRTVNPGTGEWTVPKDHSCRVGIWH